MCDLVEITSTFYKKGEKEFIPDFHMWDVDDIEDYIENNALTQDVVGFTFKSISEGRVGFTYSSGLEYLVRECSWEDILKEHREAILKDAKAMLDEINKKEIESISFDEIKPTTTQVRFIGLFKYWSCGGDNLYSEFEDGIDYLGRIKLETLINVNKNT